METVERNLSDTYHIITKFLDVVEADNLHYQLIQAPGKSGCNILQQISVNVKRDDVYKVLKPLVDMVISNNYLVLIKKENWKRLISNKTKEGTYKFIVHGVLRPSVFADFSKVILMGAMLEESTLYKLWSSDNKAQFQPYKPITKKLRFNKHQNKGTLTIKYFCDGVWSKKRFNRVIEHGGCKKRVFEHYVDSINFEFLGMPFLYSANNSEQGLFKGTDSTRLTGSPHGINKYQDYSNVAFLSALNPIPAMYNFCRSKNISGEELNQAVMNQCCYQAVMRSSLRNPESEAETTVIVPTKALAEWLADHFENVRIEQLANVPEIKLPRRGRRATGKALSDAHRKKKERRRKVLDEVVILNNLKSEKCHDNSYKTIGFNVTKNLLLPTQFFKSILHHPDSAMLQEFQSKEELIEFLEDAANRDIQSKDDNYLLSPAIFGDKISTKGTRSRTRSNVLSAWGIWLDIDGGDMTPEDLMFIFPDLEIYIFNTYSGNGRYRAFFPTTHRMTAKAYKDIQKSIRATIEASGYISKKDKELTGKEAPVHGLDDKTMNANSLFYLPCKARTGNPKDSFFLRQEGKPLDVIKWLENPLHLDECDQVKSAAKSSSQEQNELQNEEIQKQIDNYKFEYRQIPANKGLRNQAFFMLGVKLCKLGLSYGKIKAHLEEADHDGSRKRKKQIEPVINSLKKYSHVGLNTTDNLNHSGTIQ